MAIVDKTHSQTIEEAFGKMGSGGASFLKFLKKTNAIEFELEITNDVFNQMTEGGYSVPIIEYPFTTFSYEEVAELSKYGPLPIGVTNLHVYVNDTEIGRSYRGDTLEPEGTIAHSISANGDTVTSASLLTLSFVQEEVAYFGLILWATSEMFNYQGQTVTIRLDPADLVIPTEEFLNAYYLVRKL